jgi:hypothetical protein
LEAKTIETELLKQNTEQVLYKEKEKNKKLQKEIKQLKQTANSREASLSSNATVSINSSNDNDPKNDINDDWIAVLKLIAVMPPQVEGDENAHY